MAMKQRLELRPELRIALTPALRTRLSILRMGPLDLAEEVAREAARNPFLRHVAAPRSGPGPQISEVDLVAPGDGFQQDLRRQVSMKSLDPRLAAAVDFLIGELRDDGLLDVDLATLADELGGASGLLEQALGVLQGCEPPGIGARSLPECLCLQLVDLGLDRAQAEKTVAHLRDFARRDWSALSAALGLGTEALHDRAALLHRLSPRPVPACPPPQVQVLRPDLRLERRGASDLAIVCDKQARPDVWLDAAMVRRAQAEGFAPQLLARAKSLIDALDHRGRTLSRIGDWLMETQAAFFLHGPARLKPASRVALAAALGLHPSTVSRAVAGKAIEVDGRLWPLSVFFSSALAGAQGPVSSRAVKERIAGMVSDEPAERPLSDDKLVEKLGAEGIDIARRTVAKYRQGLRIPASSARRRLALARGVARQRD